MQLELNGRTALVSSASSGIGAGNLEPRSLNAASAAKAALHLWAKGLSRDVAADGVTVNTIPPGRINSEQML